MSLAGSMPISELSLYVTDTTAKIAGVLTPRPETIFQWVGYSEAGSLVLQPRSPSRTVRLRNGSALHADCDQVSLVPLRKSNADAGQSARRAATANEAGPSDAPQIHLRDDREIALYDRPGSDPVAWVRGPLPNARLIETKAPYVKIQLTLDLFVASAWIHETDVGPHAVTHRTPPPPPIAPPIRPNEGAPPEGHVWQCTHDLPLLTTVERGYRKVGAIGALVPFVAEDAGRGHGTLRSLFTDSPVIPEGNGLSVPLACCAAWRQRPGDRP